MLQSTLITYNYNRSLRTTVAAASAVPHASFASVQNASVPRPGDLLTLKCTEITTGGGICKLDNGFVIFVDKALPGEKLTARITKMGNKNKWATASKIETLHPHTNAVDPLCPHFGTCGGCSLQSLSYEAQLEAKQKRVADVFKKIGKIDNIDDIVRPAIGSAGGDSQYHYRNKVEFSFSSTADSSSSSNSTSNSDVAGTIVAKQLGGGGTDCTIKSSSKPVGRPAQFVVGLHAPGSHNTIVPIDRCELQSDVANTIYTEVKQLLQEYGLDAYQRPPRQNYRDDQQRQDRSGYNGSRRTSRYDTVNSSSDRASYSKYGRSSNSRYARNHRVRPSDTTATTTATNDSDTADGKSTTMNILQHLVIRQGTTADQKHTYLLNILTSRDARKELTPLATVLAAKLSKLSSSSEGLKEVDVVGIVNTVSQAGVAVEQRKIAQQHLLYGQDHLITHLNGLQFRVSTTSFSQVNTQQAQLLYKTVVDAAAVKTSGETVLDLFCGTGTLTCLLATEAPGSQVWGVDISKSAIEDARINATLNKLTDNNNSSVKFVCGDVGKLVPLAQNHNQNDSTSSSDVVVDEFPTRPDVVVTDPARAGMTPDVISFLKRCGARRIVYVSCDCGTQARDIKSLVGGSSTLHDDGYGSSDDDDEKGGKVYRYKLSSVTPIDLFPQTFHIETVAVLDRID